MALAVTHAFVSGIADGGDAAKVRPTNWNAAHTLTGTIDATQVADDAVTTAKIINDAVTYAKMQNVSATSRFIGRITGGAGDPEELTGTQATTLLDAFTSLLKGLVPASGGGTANFLRADATWQPVVSTPGGSDTQFQYNDSGAFGGALGLLYNDSTKTVTFDNGATADILAGLVDTTYNMISFNGILNSATGMGFAGGGSGDTSLFYIAPAGGSHVFSVGTANELEIDSAATFSPISTNTLGKATFPWANLYLDQDGSAVDFKNGGLQLMHSGDATNTLLINIGGSERVRVNSTAVITPTIAGGTGAASSLTLESTSGAGTTDNILFNTASQAERMRIDTSGRVVIKGTASSGAHVELSSRDSYLQIKTGRASPVPNAINVASYGVGTEDEFGGIIMFFRTRGAQVGTISAVQTNDGLGSIDWYADDGTSFGHYCASIYCRSDGNAVPGVAPAQLEFVTGIGTARTHMILDKRGMLTLNTEPISLPRNIATGGPLANFPQLQLLDQGGNFNGVSVHRYGANINPGYSDGPQHIFSRTTSTTAAGLGMVTNNLELGETHYCGTDTTQFVRAVSILVEVDGTPGVNDMPGRYRILTTPDGSATPIERLRINNKGSVIIGDSANALSASATDGFLYVPTCAGTPSGTPTASTGVAPIIINTTNNKLYFYSGGAWRDAGP